MSNILRAISNRTLAVTVTNATQASVVPPFADLMPLVNLNGSHAVGQAEASILSNGNYTGASTNTLVRVALSSTLVCLILATIIGNVFVISAIIIERTLRTVGNYLVLSLAATDLLVACLVMPIGAIYEVTQEWNFGTSLCEMWTFIDVLCCTASIFHLLAIACDRFWAVTTVDYIHRRKGKHVCAGIGLIWLLSALISLGPTLGWKDDAFQDRILNQKLCLVSQEISYQIFATVFSFYAPSVLLLLLYYRIYQVAKTRILLKKQRYKYRIRRRPSFYRPRKSEPELKELPSAASACLASHRSSVNPTSTDDYFSSSAMQGTSSSGVYSSSTADYTTTTTNTTYTSELERSPNSLSPLALVSENTSGLLPSELTPGKRLSIQHFLAFQQRKQSDMCEQYVLNSSHHEPELTELAEATSIIVAVPVQSNIVVYVDDFTSTVCDGTEEPIDSTNKELSEPEDEDGVTSIDENTAPFRIEDLPDETSVNFVDDNQAANPTATESTTAANYGNGHHSSSTSNSNRSNQRRESEHRKSCSKKAKQKRLKKLQFRNKITQYDNGESKQESKAAKTLTIITGVFVACWLPFFVLALVMPLCKDCVINKYFFDFCLWLGYANSTVNPFLYTIFRNAFKKLICGHRRVKKRK